MKLNLFKVRKWLGFAVAGIFPVVFFVVILMTMFNLFYAVCGVFLGMIISAVLGSLLIRHPMMQMLEGTGLLTLTFDSTGAIESFIVGVNPPYVRGYYRGKEINTTYDRDMVGYLAVPKQGKLCQAKEIDENGNIVGECTVLKMPTEKEKSDHLFSFGSFPCFIFNKNLGVFLSKNVLASNEKDTMIKHVILYILRKTEDLTNSIRDFARYVVEQTRPKKGLFANRKWLLYIVIAVIIILIIWLLAPFISGALNSAGQAGNPLPQTTIPFIRSMFL